MSFHKDPFYAPIPRPIPANSSSWRCGDRAFSLLHLSIGAVASACAGKQTGVGCAADAGYHGDSVSHSHVLDQRSGFMGGARRCSMVLCVSPPGLPVIRGYGRSRREKKEGAELRLEQTPGAPPSLISSFSFFSSFSNPFFTNFQIQGLHAAFFASYQVTESTNQIWFLKTDASVKVKLCEKI